MNKIKSSISFLDTKGPDIALPSEHGVIDLHADMSFKELKYLVDRTLVLRWDAMHPQAVELKGGYARSVEVVFVGVTSLTVSPRDPETPFETDTHLLDFEARTDPTGLRVVFNFNGGIQVAVSAADAYVDLIFEEGGAIENQKPH